MTNREKFINTVNSQLGKPYSSMGNMFAGSAGWGCAQLVAQCLNKVLGTKYIGSCYNFAGDIIKSTVENQGFNFVRTNNPIAGDVVLYYQNNNTDNLYNCGHAAMYAGNGMVVGAYGQKKIGEYGNWGDVRKTSVRGQSLGGAILYARNTLLDINGSNGIAGEYRVNVERLNVRDDCKLNSDIVAQYKKGQTVRLDEWYKINDGYVWGRYKGNTTGYYRYVAIGKNTGKTESNDYLIKM